MKQSTARYRNLEMITWLSLVSTLLVLSICHAFAKETSDPFGTESILPPAPSLHMDGAATDPCQAQPLDHALNLLEVVNLALCNNPKTREVWAISLFQAEQVGVSKADYLPSVNLNASDYRTNSGTAPGVDQRTVGVTFSYLLYDFGSRSANLENARQLLAAASATQDSTVQTVFLAAVQSYYQTQATHAALDAAIESERAAKESFAAAEARYNAGSATPADKLQAQTAYSQATLNRITADGNLKNAHGTLANMIGLDANRNVSLAPANMPSIPDNFEGDINALIEEARQRRPGSAGRRRAGEGCRSQCRCRSCSGKANDLLDCFVDQIHYRGYRLTRLIGRHQFECADLFRICNDLSRARCRGASGCQKCPTWSSDVCRWHWMSGRLIRTSPPQLNHCAPPLTCWTARNNRRALRWAATRLAWAVYWMC